MSARITVSQCACTHLQPDFFNCLQGQRFFNLCDCLPMTPHLITALLVWSLLMPTAVAQRMFDSSGRALGRVDAERFYNGSGQQLGRVDGERIYDASGRQLGRIDGTRVYSASGSPIGRIDGGTALQRFGLSHGTHRWRSAVRCIGSTHWPRRWASANANDRVFLFFHVRPWP